MDSWDDQNCWTTFYFLKHESNKIDLGLKISVTVYARAGLYHYNHTNPILKTKYKCKIGLAIFLLCCKDNAESYLSAHLNQRAPT